MPRKPRFYLPGVPAHIVQRGNNRQAVFFCDEDYQVYLMWLREGAIKCGCKVHAYVLMTNHVHLLVTPESRESISKMIQHVGRHYVQYINAVYGKTGTLWEGRHKGCVIDSDGYLLTCMRYIELNPVRAGMVDNPIDYRWSSYAANASGAIDRVVVPHDVYIGLDNHSEVRQACYRELYSNTLNPEQIDTIRATVQTGTPLGNDRFRDQVEAALGCRTGLARRGRPVAGLD
jgi:putative transposase